MIAQPEPSGEPDGGDTPLSPSPYDAAAECLRKGRLSTAFSFLHAAGCDPYDLGRFARRSELSRHEFQGAAWPILREKRQRLRALQGFMSQPTPHPSPERYPDFEGRQRAQLKLSDPDSRRSANRAWEAFRQANDPPQLFGFGPAFSWVKADRYAARIESVTANNLLWLHHRLISWGEKKKDRSWAESEPEYRVLKDMLAEPHPRLPRLVGVRAAPVFGPDGKLAMAAGYDDSSEMFVWAPDLLLPFVPEFPTRHDVARARQLLEVELLGDFPFDDESGMAHSIAAILHPFVRPMIAGPTPIHLIDKPTAGTGGTLLADVIASIALGRSPDILTAGKLEDEWRFRLVALLCTGPPIVLLDNINKMLDSATIAGMVTAPDTYMDRRVKTSEIVTFPIRCLWLLTGNNVQLSHEMARRCILIRLDSNLENPETRTGFRHRNLMAWVGEHRAELVWAALVLVQAWIAAGRPAGSQSKASFGPWAETIGGVLEVAGIPGFLANTAQVGEHADPEADAWRLFVDDWWERFETRPVRSADLLPIADKHLNIAYEPGQARSTGWGMLLSSKRGAVISGKKIVSAGVKQRAAQWRLEPVNPG